MSLLQAWQQSLQVRQLPQFLKRVVAVAWQSYKALFFYFWWAIILLVVYQFRWHEQLLLPHEVVAFITRLLEEFVEVFKSGLIFLLVSYLWVITTGRNLPRVIDYFMRLLYFFIPYVLLQATALFVQENVFSFGVVLTMYAFIVQLLFGFFLLDTYDGIRVPLIAAWRSLKLFWYNAPFFMLLGLIGIVVEVEGLSLLRWLVPIWDHELVQQELFYLLLPFLVSLCAVVYADQTNWYARRYGIE